MGSFSKLDTSCHQMFSFVYIMLYLCPFFNMVLQCGVKPTLYLDPVIKLQKTAIRAISFQPYLSHTLPIFKDLKILRLSEIFELRLLNCVYESVKKISPLCFHTFFTFNSSIHQHQTRQACHGDLYLTQKKSIQYGLKSIKYLGCKL